MIAPELLGLLGFFVMLLLLALGIPIFLSMLFVGMIGCLIILGVRGSETYFASIPVIYSTEWAFTVLPMFLLLGNLAGTSDIGPGAYVAADKWLGRFPGGLALATTGACTLLAFATGSSTATAITFGRLALPEMEKHGYDKGLACASIAAAGTLASIIPPSAMMVIFCMFTDVSLGKLLFAGIIPGIVLATVLCTTVIVIVKINPKLAPIKKQNPVSLKEKVMSLRTVGPILLIAVSVLGGIYLGIFTPTEGGALGAFVTLILFLWRTGFDMRLLGNALVDTTKTTAMIILIVIGAMILTRFLALCGTITVFGNFMLGLPVHPIGIIVIIIFSYLVLGCFMDSMGMLAITLPLFFPVVVGLGFDGVWFGVIVVLMIEIGIITPPVGLNLFAIKIVAGEGVTLQEIYKSVTPFVIGYLITIGIIVAFPIISLWLPSLMRW